MLGEAIIAVVDGISEQQWNVQSVISAILGLSIAFSLWWIYFDNIGGIPIRNARIGGKVGAVNAWLYTHLPLVIGIAATGVGVEKVLLSEPGVALPAAQRWLICGSVALCLLALGILHSTGVIRYCKIRTKYRLGAAAVLLVIAIAGVNLLPLAVIGLIALVCSIQVVQDLTQSRPTTRLVDPGI